MKHLTTLTLKEDFEEIGIQKLDSKYRLAVGQPIRSLYSCVSRVQVYANEETGDILLRPLAEIPVRELWIHKNKKVLESITKGFKQAKEGKLKDIDPKFLETEE